MVASAFQAIGGGSFLAISVVVGVRLMLLAWRNRTLPELLLGISFLAGAGIGAALEASSQAAARSIDPRTAGALLAIAKLFGLAGMGAHAAFTWRVFRPDDRWAMVLAGVVVLLLCVANLGFWGSGSFRTADTVNGWFWLELAARVTSPVWLSIEAFRYHRLMRRRVALGLAEPLVANRFWLWGVGSAIGLLVLGTSVPPLFIPDPQHPLIQLDLMIFGLAGVAACVPYLLAFFPPAAYRRLVGARGAVATG